MSTVTNDQTSAEYWNAQVATDPWQLPVASFTPAYEVWIGWDRKVRSYTCAVYDQTGQDPSAEYDGTVFTKGYEGEFPTMQALVDGTQHCVNWASSQDEKARLENFPWQCEQAFHKAS